MNCKSVVLGQEIEYFSDSSAHEEKHLICVTWSAKACRKVFTVHQILG